MTTPTHDLNDVLQQIAAGAYDARLNEIDRVVKERIVAADPWNDIGILTDIAQHIRLLRAASMVDRGRYGAEAVSRLQHMIPRRTNDPLVGPLLAIVQRDICSVLLDMKDEDVDKVMETGRIANKPPPPDTP